MTTILLAFLSFVLVFAIVVFVHELGHFWVARRVGVRVLRFSIGFGPVLWNKVDKQGTQFAISAIPLGGYVKMLDGREQTLQEEEKPFAFDHKSVGKRMAVVLAGPLFNFLFAIAAFTLVFMIGVQKVVPLIAEVKISSPAATAGIQAGDEFVSVAGEATPDWRTVDRILQQHTGEQSNIEVVVRQFPDQPLRHYALPLSATAPLNAWGITLGVPNMPAIIGDVLPDTPAAAADFQKNDRVIDIDGKAVNNWYELVDYVRSHPKQAITFTIERAGENLTKIITPTEQEIEGVKVGAIGVTLAVLAMPADFIRIQRVDPFTALYKGVLNTWDLSILTFDIIGKMLTGSASLENLAGPISIAQGAQQSVESGWISFVSFLILLSVNLGVINLLPIPMLDGGHLLYYVFEFIRGKPLSEKAQRLGFCMGVVLVVGLMFIGIYNDITRF